MDSIISYSYAVVYYHNDIIMSSEFNTKSPLAPLFWLDFEEE
jgi:hypothetical protein